MLILQCPASYLPSIEKDIRRCIRELDGLPPDMRQIFLDDSTESAIIVLGAIPADASERVFQVEGEAA